MRETWLIHLCTDWMGDDAWLWKLDCEFRQFNYVGDTQWLHGRIVRKYLAEGGRPAVDLELWARNQRGEITTPGHATILLPSREHGPVVLPDPPGGAADLEGGPRGHRRRLRRRHGGAAPMTDPRYHPVDGLSVEVRGAVLRLQLDRPAARNAIDDTMMAGLIDAVDTAGRDEGVRAIHLSGAGDHFCGGADIVARNSGDQPRPRVGAIQRRLPSQAHRLLPLLCSVQVPVVCAVRGWAAGIGLQLATGGRLHRGRRRRPFLGAVLRSRVHPRQRSDLAAAPGDRRGPGPGDAAARTRGRRGRGGGVGPGPSGRARRRGGPGVRRAGRHPGRRADGGPRADQVAAPRRHLGAPGGSAPQRGTGPRALVPERGLPRGSRCLRGPPAPRTSRAADARRRREPGVRDRAADRGAVGPGPALGGGRRTRGLAPGGRTTAVRRPCARCGPVPPTRPGTRCSRPPAWSPRPGRWSTAAPG